MIHVISIGYAILFKRVKKTHMLKIDLSEQATVFIL